MEADRVYYTACQDVRLQGSRVRQGAKHRCRQSWGERGDTEEANRGDGPMGDLGTKGDRGAMVGDGAKV
tara:strand:+ start:444 stop:650 length:207 start_codon:yes stop_codon:yes gene_type:complete